MSDVIEPKAEIEKPEPKKPAAKKAAAKEPFRPSDIPKNVEDRAQWLREKGKQNPLRCYRVKVASQPKDSPECPECEIDAVDEAAAINEFIRLREIKVGAVCHHSFTVVCIKE